MRIKNTLIATNGDGGITPLNYYMNYEKKMDYLEWKKLWEVKIDYFLE